MRHPKIIESQLKRIGFNLTFWNRAEVRELSNILWDDEEVARCVSGLYENGIALLVATNHRLLLVDRKPLGFLTVQDLRFEMITDFNYTHRVAMADVHVCTPHKELAFRSYNKLALRKLLEFVQQRVISARQQQQLGTAQYTATEPPRRPEPNPMTTPLQHQYPSQVQAQASATAAPPVAPSGAPEASPSAYASQPNVTLANNINYRNYAERKRELLARLGAYTVSKLPGMRFTPDA
jgi:hypothetical protein